MTSTDTRSAATVPLRSLVRQTPDTVTLVLDSWFDYRPGQSLQVRFPNDTKGRFYSLSSSPTEKGSMAITVKTPVGHAARPIIQSLKPGDPLQVTGPLGSFGLPETLEGPFSFIAAGSGVTPCRAMIKYLIDSGSKTEKRLFFSVRSVVDEIFKSDFESWMALDSKFHRILSVTGESDESWTGSRGRFNEAFFKQHRLQSAGHFFLCGPPAFVADMEHLLTQKLGVPISGIRREQW